MLIGWLRNLACSLHISGSSMIYFPLRHGYSMHDAGLRKICWWYVLLCPRSSAPTSRLRGLGIIPALVAVIGSIGHASTLAKIMSSSSSFQ